MGGLNMTMVNSLSILLGSVRYPNSSLQIHHDSKMSSSSDGGCGCHQKSCCHDPCALDPPEVLRDPLEGIPADDESLSILVGLQWPRRDFSWYMEVIVEFIKPKVATKRQASDRKKRQASDILSPTEVIIEDPFFGSTTRSAQTTQTTTSSPELPTSEGITFTTEHTTPVPTTTHGTTTTPQGPTTTSQGPTTTPQIPTTTPQGTTTIPGSITTQGTTTTPQDTTSIHGSTTTEGTTSTTEGTTTTPEVTTQVITPPDNPIRGSVNFTNVTDEEISLAREFAKEMALESVFQLVSQDTAPQQKAGLVEGKTQLEKKDEIEAAMEAANITFSEDDPSLKHQSAFRRTDPISTMMARGGLIQIEATRVFQESFSIPGEAVSGLVIFGNLSGCSDELIDFERPQFVVCDPSSPYRKLDGSCNNLANSFWGAAFRPYRRDLRAEYDDGISTFRRSVVGSSDLPSARLVSTAINRIRSEGSHNFSILHMTFGQFLDHDLVATPLAQVTSSIYGGGGPVRCCETPFLHPECAPISIPDADEFYSCHGQTCMEFVRSAPIQPFCRFFPREQVVSIRPTWTAPSSTGSGLIRLTSLNFTCGLLKGQVTEDGQMLLPQELNLQDGCNTKSMVGEGKHCFKAGDGRVNEQVLLTFFQTLFAREHNRIAKILCKCNGDWDDEKVFQETRKIVWALLQQVTYNEFLPTIIGPTLMTSSKLFPLKGDQQTNDYDPYINAAIANNFATAAYRFGHSLIADNLLYVTRHGRTSPKPLSTLYFNPFEFYQRDAMCDVARGGLNLPEDKMDPYFTLEVAGKLFRGPHPFGLDLLALNIQRGRDHGLPPYNRWRVFCGLKSASSFSELSKEMTQDRIDALKKVYMSVEDIDLYAGGVSENPIPGSILGHTMTCLIHNQFFRMKYGDRYWFEYKDSPGAFNPAQMEQLHNATLAMIMCNNLPELEYVQRWPLKSPGPDNPKICCKSIRRYSLKPWTPLCPEDKDQDEDCHERKTMEKVHNSYH
ncbi:LOW QUALITY PROTEIN: chorion peroxidase-like [Macrobrachium nipponense]|uniref:LOW QUALITY PROTEIN: chorion peroxidase-like n=1 Tax=Macrobrachium nipponense TaxID=159736 RepID=UPI0030C7DF08